MKVVVTHPYCWPYVRRGSERFIAEFAAYLATRGHEVTTLSSKPGPGIVQNEENQRRILLRQYWFPFLRKARIQPLHSFVFSAYAALRNVEADVVHSLHYADAAAANVEKRRHRRTYSTVYQVTGPAVPNHFPRIPPDRWLLKRAILDTETVIAHSRFTGQIVEEYYRRSACVIPVPIDLSRFEFLPRTASDHPVLLGVADFDVPGKGLRILLQAFQIVGAKLPGVRLQLSGNLSLRTQDELMKAIAPAVRGRIEVLGLGKPGDLPQLYRNATVTVLPSMWEAYGMVVVESWACGTHVVVTNHGGFPELVTAPALGTMFPPGSTGHEATNAEGLAEAILVGIEKGQADETRMECRAQAEKFSWSNLGPLYERAWTRT